MTTYRITYSTGFELVFNCASLEAAKEKALYHWGWLVDHCHIYETDSPSMRVSYSEDGCVLRCQRLLIEGLWTWVEVSP